MSLNTKLLKAADLGVKKKPKTSYNDQCSNVPLQSEGKILHLSPHVSMSLSLHGEISEVLESELQKLPSSEHQCPCSIEAVIVLNLKVVPVSSFVLGVQ